MLSGVWVCICVPLTTLRNVCSERSSEVRVYKLAAKLSPNHYLCLRLLLDTVTACCQLALLMVPQWVEHV